MKLDFRLIRDLSELHGTCYIELLPGPFQDKCWNQGSIFVEEGIFGLFEDIIQRHEPRFDHFAFVEIRKYAWERIIIDFDRLENRLRKAREIADLKEEGFLFQASAFAAEFNTNVNALASMLKELITWLREQLRIHEGISVLGM
jgi:hypothetical protein